MQQRERGELKEERQGSVDSVGVHHLLTRFDQRFVLTSREKNEAALEEIEA